MTDITPIKEAFYKLSKSDKEVFFYELAKLVIADHEGETTIRLADPEGKCLGFLFSPQRSTTPPRPTTTEERAEDARRLANRDDAVTAEEIIVLARKVGNRAPAAP